VSEDLVLVSASVEKLKMIEYVSTPDNCPFRRIDFDGFPDGCKFDETECLDDDFPEDCPLRNEDIIVKKD